MSDSQTVVVKSKDVSLVVETPEVGNVNRVELQALFENAPKQLISRYCSLEEEKTRCVGIQPERISLQHGNVSVTLPNVGTSDARKYVVEVIGNNFTKKKFFTLVFHGEYSERLKLYLDSIDG